MRGLDLLNQTNAWKNYERICGHPRVSLSEQKNLHGVVSEIDTVRVVITTKGKEEKDEKEVALQKVCTAAPTVYALRLFACKNG
jgi:hypothetical protein